MCTTAIARAPKISPTFALLELAFSIDDFWMQNPDLGQGLPQNKFMLVQFNFSD